MFANLGIAVTKFVAFLLRASSSMLAESVYSLVDTSNHASLLRGGKRAKRAIRVVGGRLRGHRREF